MSTAIKFRGGTTTQHSTFTGAAREITVDTTKNAVIVHDGATPGGTPMAKESALANYVPIAGGTLTGALNEAQGANIASAATVNLTTATGNYAHITGTTNITAITLAQGAERTVVFDGALTLTNGASLLLPTASNIATAAGDSAVFRGEAAGVVRCVNYTRKNGVALASSNVGLQSVTSSVAANALTLNYNGGTLDFRSPTASTGAPVSGVSIAANSIVVPSGATLGMTNGNGARLVLLEAYNGGSPVACVVNLAGGLQLDETNLISPTTISAGATSSNVIYSASAVSANSPYRVVGFFDIVEATAGTWVSDATLKQGAGGQALQHIGAILNGASVASTSGTSIDFTGIPAWVKRITVLFNGVSTSGTSNLLVQVGAGSVVTSGYASGASTMVSGNVTGGATSTAGFISGYMNSSAYFICGRVSLMLFSSSNQWIMSGNTSTSTYASSMVSAGNITLSGTLDRVRITTTNGTDTFDAGSINILYE